MALTYSNIKSESDGSQLKKLVDISFDASYPTGGYTLELNKVGLTNLKRIKAQPEQNFEFEYDYTTNKLMVLQSTVTAAAGAVGLTPTHDALSTNHPNLYVKQFRYNGDGFANEGILAADMDLSTLEESVELDSNGMAGGVQHIPINEMEIGITHQAVPTGNQIYFHYTDPSKNIGVLKSDNAVAGATVNFSDNPATDIIPVIHDANAADGGIPVFFDESAGNGLKYVLVMPDATSAVVRSFKGRYVTFAHDAGAAAHPALICNDTTANDWDRLEFISPTTSSTSNITNSLIAYQDIESCILTQVYTDEDAAGPNSGTFLTIHPAATPVIRVNFAGKYYGVFHDVNAAVDGVVTYYNDGGADGQRIVFNSPTASNTQVDADTTASKNYESTGGGGGTAEVANGTNLTALNKVEVEMTGY